MTPADLCLAYAVECKGFNIQTLELGNVETGKPQMVRIHCRPDGHMVYPPIVPNYLADSAELWQAFCALPAEDRVNLCKQPQIDPSAILIACVKRKVAVL